MENHYNCIYMYTNLINEKKYVGKAKDFNKRHNQHLKHKKDLIDKKIKEYGIENFKVEILIENVQDNDKLNEYEKFFIKRKRSHVSYGTGYNRTWGGDGGDTISGMTDEQRKEYSRKLSESRKGEKNPNYGVHRYGKDSPRYGHKHSDEFKKHLSEAFKGEKHPMYGKPRSNETRQKISETKKGYKHKKESRQKMSEQRKGKNIGLNNPSSKKVICLEIGQIFDCIKEANEWCGKRGVSACCQGRQKTAGGYHWMYYDEYLKLQEEEQQNKKQDLVTEVA